MLSRYRPDIDWGNGRANLAALRAVLDLFKDPLPERIAVRLALDGKLVAEGTIDGRHKEVLAIDAPVRDLAGKHRWTVTADPPLPGLGFALDVVAYQSWQDDHGAR